MCVLSEELFQIILRYLKIVLIVFLIFLIFYFLPLIKLKINYLATRIIETYKIFPFFVN